MELKTVAKLVQELIMLKSGINTTSSNNSCCSSSSSSTQHKCYIICASFYLSDKPKDFKNFLVSMLSLMNGTENCSKTCTRTSNAYK